MPKRRKTNIPFNRLSKKGKTYRLNQELLDEKNYVHSDEVSVASSSSAIVNSFSEANNKDTIIDHISSTCPNIDVDSTSEISCAATVSNCSSSNESLEYTEEGEMVFESDFEESSLFTNNEPGANLNLQEFLRNWALNNNITLSALSSLAKGLKKHHPTCFQNLANDGRTILKTPSQVEVISLEPHGHYIHIGLVKQLTMIVSQIQHDISIGSIDLIFNIDGLKLHTSSPSEVIPILFSIPSLKQFKNKIFPVGIFYGTTKPDLFSFLNSTIQELNSVLTNGFVLNNVSYDVKLLGFSCDVPAKSYVMGTVGHSGFKSCTRCKVYGRSVGPKGKKKRVFLETESPQRTHEDFINNTDPQYTRRDTPLIQVTDLDFVKDFFLDYMHLVCLGVVRKMLFSWCFGVNGCLKLSNQQQRMMSNHLLKLRSAIPRDFARRPRELNVLKYWKATEYRMFLLYLGPVVLKNVLSSDKYDHFMTLHVAISVLLNRDKCKIPDNVEYARSLLKYFVTDVVHIYTKAMVTFNFHGLLHLADDITNFVDLIPDLTLHTLSAFPFENYMQKIKRMVRSKAKPLQQIGKRIGEVFANQNHTNIGEVQPTTTGFKREHTDGPLLLMCSGPQYKEMVFPDFVLSSSRPDNCCGLKNGNVVVIENFAFSHELQERVIIGKNYVYKSNFYPERLCDSSRLGVFKVEKLGGRKFWRCSDIIVKLLLVAKDNYEVVFPLLHCDN